MKKLTAIILAVLMLFSAMSVMASAIEIQEVEVTGNCTHHKLNDAVYGCTCCIFCPGFDVSLLTACAKNQTNNTKYDGSLCCYECTGIYPCDCGCECCGQIEEDEGYLPIIDENDRENFVSAFQAFLKKVSDWFDMVFNAIFEFLRLDEVLPGARG